jgi:lipoate---protein ligase
MFCITLESTNPYFNLAIEEILLKNRTEEYLILGINTSSLITGKHQSPRIEINTQFVTENKIPVLRRISGGGTVYHDPGNLNFTFIKTSEAGKQVDFRKYTHPVIDFLKTSGIDARFEGKNDLKVGGLKISGNAEHVHRNRVLHHGTLLFSTSLDMLRNSLRKDTTCYTSRAVGSNPSSVTNLSGMMPRCKDIYEFRNMMMDYFLRNLPDAQKYELSPKEINEASDLADSKYRSWEWIWAYGPEYHFFKQFEYSGEPASCRLYVAEGTIRDCVLTGPAELVKISEKLIGKRHMVEDINDLFQEEEIFASDFSIFNFF